MYQSNNIQVLFILMFSLLANKYKWKCTILAYMYEESRDQAVQM